MLKTKSGINVVEITTEDFARMLLENPQTIYTVATDLDDSDELDKWLWYCAANVKLFDVYTVHMNKGSLFGGAPYSFDIPDYNDTLPSSERKAMLDECLPNVVEGLKTYSDKQDKNTVWYIAEDETVKVKLVFTSLSNK